MNLIFLAPEMMDWSAHADVFLLSMKKKPSHIEENIQVIQFSPLKKINCRLLSVSVLLPRQGVFLSFLALKTISFL